MLQARHFLLGSFSGEGTPRKRGPPYRFTCTETTAVEPGALGHSFNGEGANEGQRGDALEFPEVHKTVGSAPSVKNDRTAGRTAGFDLHPLLKGFAAFAGPCAGFGVGFVGVGGHTRPPDMQKMSSKTV